MSLGRALAAFLAPLLVGCASDDPPLLPARTPLPANLLTPCGVLSPLSDGSGASVLRKLVEVSEVFHECRRRHGALVEAVKQ